MEVKIYLLIFVSKWWNFIFDAVNFDFKFIFDFRNSTDNSLSVNINVKMIISNSGEFYRVDFSKSFKFYNFGCSLAMGLFILFKLFFYTLK